MQGVKMVENDTEKKLTPAQWRAVEALLVSGSVSVAATASGHSRKTIYRWLREPAFASALGQAEREALAQLSRDLAGMAGLAANVIRETLSSATATTATRLRAAEMLIGNLVKLRELGDMESRLAALEEAHHAK